MRRLASVESQIGLETVAAALATEAGLLVPAERRRWIEAVERVRPHHPCTQTLRHPEDARALLGPDTCAEAVRRVVPLLDRLLGRAEGEHRKHRSEDLLLRDAVALRDVREDRRREPVALLRQPARRLIDLGALLLAGIDELANLFELLLRVDRSDVGVLVQWVADAKRREAALQLLDDRLVDRLLHEETRAGAADVTLVEVDAVDDPLDRLVERGVVEDDVRGLAAELERQLLAGACEPALDRLADLRRAGERDLVDGCVDERSSGPAVAGDDVDDTRWQLRLADDVAEEERGQRRRLCRLEDDGVARRERGRELPRQHQQREVPRDDLARDADRPRRAVRERVLE